MGTGNKFSGDFDPERMQDFPSFREELERMRHDAVNKMASSKAEWLDSNLAGLLAAGVPKSDIEIQEHPNLRTIIAVRGVPSFEWIGRFDAGEVPTEDWLSERRDRK